MKITKTLSILSVISCCIYIIAAFSLAIFPSQVCILFGMKKYMGINPDYVAHSITPPLPDEAYTIDPVYTVLHIAVIAFCLVFVILSAILVLQKKTKRFPVFLAAFSSAAFGIISILVQMVTEYTLSSSSHSEVNFYIVNSIHRFFLLFGVCGAVLCVISAVYSKTKLSPYVLSIASICCSILYLIPNAGSLLLNGYLNEYGKYYSVAAVGFIILSILSYFGKTGRRIAVCAVVFAAAFPLVLQLFLMFGTGDYYGFMSLNGRINDNDTILCNWLISGIFCAVSSLKGAYNDRQLA